MILLLLTLGGGEAPVVVVIPRHSTAIVTVPDLPSATVRRAGDDD